MIEETITITMKRYKKLMDDSRKLIALENAGVDNWEGYGEALGQDEEDDFDEIDEEDEKYLGDGQ